MIAFDGVFGLVLLGLWIFCIIDVITTDAGLIRNLPKAVWLLLVLVLPDIGSIAWLIAGRPWAAHNSRLPHKGNAGGGPQAPTPRRATNPDDDEEFQATLRRRAQEQRRRADPPQA